MAGVSLTGTHGLVFEPRKLTVKQLQKYIRRGCVCCVCEFARAEIRERQREAIEARQEEPAARAIGEGR